ncbi:MAG: alkaline phosphatase [Porphyromonas sp.]|nr:alkaline phosphatase [Porphyromonas sp.]
MNRKFCTLIVACLLFLQAGVASAVLPDTIPQVRNIILMIPDGCSLASYSLARWYQRYKDPSKLHLNIDPYIRGTVLTYCSDAPVGDSAPTTSCYVSGVPSKAGYVATYPKSEGENDLIPLDPKKAYSPLVTLLEAGKIALGKRSGLVFTCEFTHATPADCSAHSADRKRYDMIAPQMVHQNVDVVIGGGTYLLSRDLKQELIDRGYELLLDDLRGLRESHSSKLWSLFGAYDMPNDFDRDTTRYPSIAEMTEVAIARLNDPTSPGFFLMVEGSKVDWAAHANDPVGIVSELLAFDRAFAVALDFAKRDGRTAVVLLSDHGNSGISIGREGIGKLHHLSKDQLFAAMSAHKYTAEGLARILAAHPYESVDSLLWDASHIRLGEEEREALIHCSDYAASPMAKDQRGELDGNSFAARSLQDFCCKLLTKHSPVGFTTHGHTAEDVLLTAYHPAGAEPRGMLINTELAQYLAALWGLKAPYTELGDQIFAPHTEVFEGMMVKVLPAKRSHKELKKLQSYHDVDLTDFAPELEVRHKGKKLRLKPYTNYVDLNGKREYLQSVIVYAPENETFYLPRTLRALLIGNK